MASPARLCPHAVAAFLISIHAVRSSPLPFYHTSAELHDALVALRSRCGGANLTLDEGSRASAGSNGTGVLDVVTVRPLRDTSSEGGTPGHSGSLRGGAQRWRNRTLRAMLVFGEHARELISSESGLHLLRALCEQTPARWVDDLGGVAELKVVVNANPKGRRAAEQGEWCRRTNEDKVDLNRNWGSHFSGSGDSQGTFPGPTSFSEPETRELRDLAEAFRPHLFLSVHSGGLVLGTPFGYDNAVPQPRSFERMIRVLKPISDKYCSCPVGGLADFMQYRAPGNAIDYVYSELHVPFAFTWEIYASDDEARAFRERRAREAFSAHGEVDMREYTVQSEASRREEDTEERETPLAADVDGDVDPECFSFFNPTSREEYGDVLQRWTSAYVDVIVAVAREVESDGA